ncbi:InlB B-repeat-containing protein [Candidatus Saccharibacteria bacterium]|nr:InlB B-repeat-containing protein [Candidatus Saccharibacteria bacterium]
MQALIIKRKLRGVVSTFVAAAFLLIGGLWVSSIANAATSFSASIAQNAAGRYILTITPNTTTGVIVNGQGGGQSNDSSTRTLDMGTDLASIINRLFDENNNLKIPATVGDALDGADGICVYHEGNDNRKKECDGASEVNFNLEIVIRLHQNCGDGDETVVTRSVPISSRSFQIPSAASLGFSCDGYTLSGWARNANGDGAVSDPTSVPISIGIDVDLYAQWSQNTYSVTFEPCGGSPVVKSVSHGAPFQSDWATAVELDSDNTYFDGWLQSLPADGTPITSSLTFEAKCHPWVAVNFESDTCDLSGTTSYPQLKVGDQFPAIPTIVPGVDGYVLDPEWSPAPDASNPIADGQNYTYTANCAEKLTVTFVAGPSGQLDVDPATGKYMPDDTFPTPPNPIPDTDYYFAGWSKTGDGSDLIRTADLPSTVTESATYTAIFAPILKDYGTVVATCTIPTVTYNGTLYRMSDLNGANAIVSIDRTGLAPGFRAVQAGNAYTSVTGTNVGSYTANSWRIDIYYDYTDGYGVRHTDIVGTITSCVGGIDVNGNGKPGFIVAPAEVTIKANDNQKVYGSSDPTLTCTITDGQLFGSDAEALNISCDRDPGEDVGDYVIRPSYTDNATSRNYQIRVVNGNFKITKASLTVCVENATTTCDPDDPSANWDVSITGGVYRYDGNEHNVRVYIRNSELTYDLPLPAGVTNVGSKNICVPIFGKPGYESNYQSQSICADVTVVPAIAIIKVDSKSKVYGDPNPVFTGSVRGLVNPDDLGVVEYFRTSTNENVGFYPRDLDVRYTPNSNYNVRVIKGNFTITALPVTPQLTPPITPTNPIVPPIVTVAAAIDTIAEAITTPDPEPFNYTPPARNDDTGEVLGARDENYWALLNLLLAIGTVLASVVVLILYFTGRKDDEDEQEKEEVKRHGVARVLSIVPAVAAVIAFILTEDWTLPMRWVDRWTLLMVLIAVVQIVVLIFARKKREGESEG